MVVKSSNIIKDNNKYCFRRKGGRSLNEHAPVFSPDGLHVLLIVEKIVCLHNIKTGECVRVLEPEQEVKRLISVQFPYDEDYNVYGCSDEGLVTVWSWEGPVLREQQLQLPEGSKVTTFDILDSKECFITFLPNIDSKSLHLSKFSLKTGEKLQQYDEIIYNKILKVAVGWYQTESFAAICNGTRHLFLFNLTKNYITAVHTNYNDIRILTVSAHPTEAAVAIGDALGRAFVFKGNLFSKDVGREMLHWHSLPLIATAFSLQGSYLMTGGMEKVLVKWTLSGLANKPKEKSFMPRLPGNIRHIATSNAHVALTLTNNSVVIASAQLHLVSTVLECGGLSGVVRSLGPALLYHRPLAALLLPGRTGHLQLYSTTTDKVLYNVDITGVNDVPAARHNLVPCDTEVTCASLSSDGSWLVTSEYRNDGVTHPEERLKFWASNPGSTPFILNTCVNLSHGGCNVISIALNNTGDFCVTAGTDQKFRIWKREVNQKKKVSWKCLTACYYSSGIGASLDHSELNRYKHFQLSKSNKVEFEYQTKTNGDDDVIKVVLGVTKPDFSWKSDVGLIRTKEAIAADEAMGGVAISQDGSLIAAWFGAKLTLWDTHSCELRSTLSHPSLKPKGIDVKFGNEDAAHYLVCTTEHCIGVWSLLSLTVRWLVHVRPTALCTDPFSNKMAVVTDNNDVFVFTPHNSTPIFSRKNLMDRKGGVIKHCAFGTANDDQIRLFMSRNDSEIYCLEPEETDDGPLEVLSRRSLPASNFSALLAEQQVSGVKAVTPSADTYVDSDALGKGALAQFFSSAPHMVPSVGLLCTSFLEHISGKKESSLEDDPNQDMEVDPTSSDDEEFQVNESSKPKKVELWALDLEQVKEKRLKKIVREESLSSGMIGELLD